MLDALFGVATDVGVLKGYSQSPREFSGHLKRSEPLWEELNGLIDAEAPLYSEVVRSARSTLVFDGGSIPPVDFPSQGVSGK